MSRIELLSDCREYFQRAQQWWHAYFSKWEYKAKDEDIEEVEEEQSDIEIRKPVDKIGKENLKLSKARKLRKKSIATLNKTKKTDSAKAKRSNKKVQSKNLEQKRGREIIHTAENKTNSECEFLNNKHFEADLKAIFIELMSENTNNAGMFSVLSRMFSANLDAAKDFSLSSTIVEKSEFSISPVGETILHSARNEFRNWNFPQCDGPNGSGRWQLTDAALRGTLQNALAPHQNSNDRRMDLSRGCVPMNILSPERIFPRFGNDSNVNVQRLFFYESTLKTPLRKSLVEVPETGLSPKEILDKIMRTPSSSVTASDTPQCARKYWSENQRQSKRSRKRQNQLSDVSDEDSKDERGDSSVARCLKIFCTPTRPRKYFKLEKTRESQDSDEEECFNIFDRE